MRKVTLHPSLLRKKEADSVVQTSVIKSSEEKPSVKLPESGGITITSIDGRFSILRPKSSVPEKCQSILTRNPEDVLSFLRSVKLEDSEDLVTFDTETTGTQIFGNKDFRIVTVGLGHQDRAISLDVRDLSKEELSAFLRSLRDLTYELNIPLAAHNLFFDASTVAYYLGSVKGDKSGAPGWMNYKYCTYALFRYLGSEGFVGQSHSLKFAMKELMLWTDTNEKDQHEWLINNGYVKGPRGIHNEAGKGTPEERLKLLREKIAEGKQYKPDKGQMYRVPHEILGKYNALDCYATYRFYRDVLLPAMRKYTTKTFEWWQSEIMIMAIRNAVDNYQDGIYIDHEILDNYAVYMKKRLKGKVFTKFSRGKYREAYLKIAEDKYKRYRETKLPKTTHKQICVKESTAPKKYTKAGYLTTSWTRWELKRRRAERLKGQTVPTKAYVQYKARCKQLRKFIKQGLISSNFSDKHWAYKFLLNPGSVADKVPFLFHKIDYTIVPSKYEDRAGRLRLKNGIEVDMSDSGAMPTGKSAITAIGGKKHVLNLYNREIKKLQFVENAQRKVRSSDDGLLHAGFKVPGTNTQRVSGDGGLNCQNIIKDPEFLRAWQCKKKETHLICQSDAAALEPHVFTELSRDAAMLKLYGPGAKPNDVYLFTGASIGGILGQPFLDLGYDPLNPTKEAMKACKEKYKNLRNVSKTLLLSDDYMSGPYKKWQTLKIQGFDFTLKEVEEMHNKLAEVYKGKKIFGEKLKAEWERNRGFVLDGFGFPTCVHHTKLRDVVNRVIQRSGHMILQLWTYLIVKKFWEENIDYSFHIHDFHDELVAEVHYTQIARAKEIYAETLAEVNNKYLKGQIKIKAEPQIATCLAEIKVENYVDEELKYLMDKLS